MNVHYCGPVFSWNSQRLLGKYEQGTSVGDLDAILEIANSL
jgi:hypothetical protein